MSTDTTILAGLILKALDSGRQLPEVMEMILDEAENAQNAEGHVRQIIESIQVYPGVDYDDDREKAIALLQHVLEDDI